MGKTFLHKIFLCILSVSPSSIYSQVINPDKWASWTAHIFLLMLVPLPVLNSGSLFTRSCFMMLGERRHFRVRNVFVIWYFTLLNVIFLQLNVL